MSHFSYVTLFLLIMGWATHWLITIRAAKAASIVAKTPPPSWRSYWSADPESFWISIIGCAVGYWVIPWIGETYPDIARFIGSTASNPMNPMAAYLGGFVMPALADMAGKRMATLVGP